jgi:hypothetical protein
MPAQIALIWITKAQNVVRDQWSTGVRSWVRHGGDHGCQRPGQESDLRMLTHHPHGRVDLPLARRRPLVRPALQAT